MPMPKKDNLPQGYFYDPKQGLLIPTSLRQIKASPNPISPAKGNGGTARQTPSGVEIQHDEEYSIPKWPNFGSGYDDALNRALAAGSMANGGMTPVLNTMVMTIVSKLQMMAATWIISARGKQSPLNKALSVINAADDGDGPHNFVRSVIGTMLVDNRGVFISYVPIGAIEYDAWERYGLTTEPLSSESETYRVLSLTSDSARENRGVWTIDGLLNCIPTGIPAYPYWLRKKSLKENKEYWILVPREFGTQIVQQVGSKQDVYAGIGSSNVWMCSPYIAKGMVLERMDWEALSSRPMEGIVYGSGLDTPDQLHTQYKSFIAEQQEDGNLLFKGVMFAGTVNENSRITVIPWSAPPPGYDPEKWDNIVAQAISGAFHVSPVHVRAALVGSGPAIETLMGALEGETSLAYARNILTTVFDLATPPRVYIKLIPKSDSQLHKQAETFAVWMLGLSRAASKTSTDPEDGPVFTKAEIRAFMEQEIGIRIPDTSEGVKSADTRDTDDIAATFVPTANLIPLDATLTNEYAAAGMFVADNEGRLYLSTGKGTGNFIWCQPATGIGQWLLSVDTLYGLPKKNKPVKYEAKPERLLLPSDLPTQNETVAPSGSPLPEPTEDDVAIEDWDEAIAAAIALWNEFMAEDFSDWAWDEGERAWVDPDAGQVMTPLEMAEMRNQFLLAAANDEKNSDSSLINQLIVAAIALTAWETLFRQRLIPLHILMYIFGNGNQELSDADKLRIQTELLSQFQFLNAFSRDIAAGNKSDAAARNQASLYYDSASGSHERGRTSAYNQEMVLPCYPGDCSSECCSRCGCYWELNLVGNVIEATWHRTKMESCATCLSREGCDPVMFTPETGEYQNTDCYGGREEDENG